MASYVNPSRINAYSVNDESRIHDALSTKPLKSVAAESGSMTDVHVPVIPVTIVFSFVGKWMKRERLTSSAFRQCIPAS